MDRRSFLSAAAAGCCVSVAGRSARGDEPTVSLKPRSRHSPFTLKYAPHFGLFEQSAGKDHVDQLRFAADQGFRAWEHNGMKGETVETQRRIARAMEQLDMQMGVISALRGVWGKVNFAGDKDAPRQEVLNALAETIDVAKRVRAKWLTVVPGMADPRLPRDYQTAYCIELLKQCCDTVEPHGLVMVLEPLNQLQNHPGVFLSGSAQAYAICRAVDRPSCKILFDVYHQQITEGNLLVNIDRCWSEIAYFQTGDNPGRNEPGTGEINYANVLRRLQQKGYDGVIGMEHGQSRQGAAGEQAVIEAYRRVDPRS